jgi:hypothetical protein
LKRRDSYQTAGAERGNAPGNQEEEFDGGARIAQTPCPAGDAEE